jgi:hypothetical protein
VKEPVYAFLMGVSETFRFRTLRVASGRGICGVATLVHSVGYALRIAPSICTRAERNAAHLERAHRLQQLVGVADKTRWPRGGLIQCRGVAHAVCRVSPISR